MKRKKKPCPNIKSIKLQKSERKKNYNLILFLFFKKLKKLKGSHLLQQQKTETDCIFKFGHNKIIGGFL